jgi:hypothetical protein
VNQRALDLSVMARGQLAWVGPGVHSLTTSELLTWMTIRIAVNDDVRLREIAEDFDLRQASTERRGRAWFRQAMSRGDGLIVIAAGPHHEGPPPSDAR